MENKKLILTVGIIIVALLALFFVFKNVVSSTKIAEENDLLDLTDVATSTDSQTTASTTPIKTQTVSIKDSAWAVFQKYLAFNKVKNLDGVKSLVYKISSVCASVVASDECKNRMDMAYSYGSALKKADFTNVWSDSKQTILATNFKINEDDTAIGRNRAIIFFVKNSSGDLVLLSFSPFQGTVLQKASSTRQDLLNKLTTYTEDTDEDGIANYEEECLAPYDSPTCIKTNPNLRDTDGNGFWDGVQALMK